MRFLTMTCNPAADVTYLLAQVNLGAINRVDRVLPVPGGKGNNVARVLAALGHAPVATGLAGGHTGRWLSEELAAAGVRPAFVAVAGESRTCLTIVEQATGRITELREPGHAVTPDDAERLLDRVRELAATAEVAVISGSLPPGLPADFYATLISALKRAGVFVALDVGGPALRHGLAAGPDLIKPNREELAGLLGPVGDGLAAATMAQQRVLGPLLADSAMVLLSLGAAGAALISRQRIIFAPAPEVPVTNPVGAGDALLAGYLDARARGAADEDAIAHAVAVGTAAAQQVAVGGVDPEQVALLRPDVRARVTVTVGPVAEPAAAGPVAAGGVRGS